MREQPPQIFAASVLEIPVQFVLDANGFSINERGKSTQLSWDRIRGMGLATARGRGSMGTSGWIYVAHVPPGRAAPELVPVGVDYQDAQCLALVEALKRTSLWRGEGSTLGMRSTLGFSNKRVYAIVAAIIGVTLLLSAIAVGLVLILSSAPGPRRRH